MLSNASSGTGIYSPDEVTAAERRYAVFTLRKQGFDFFQIAEEIKRRFPDSVSDKYDKINVWNDLNVIFNAMRETMQETVADVVVIESARLDTMIRALWPKVEAGRERAIEIALKVMERRAKLLGLDTAIRIDWRVEVASLIETGSITLEEARLHLGDELFDGLLRFMEQQKRDALAAGGPLASTTFAQAKQLTNKNKEMVQLVEGDLESPAVESLSELRPMTPLFEGAL